MIHDISRNKIIGEKHTHIHTRTHTHIHTHTHTHIHTLRVVQVAVRLGEFRDLVKEVVRSACRTALLEAGFTPDDYFYDGTETPAMFAGKCVICFVCDTG